MGKRPDFRKVLNDTAYSLWVSNETCLLVVSQKHGKRWRVLESVVLERFKKPERPRISVTEKTEPDTTQAPDMSEIFEEA